MLVELEKIPVTKRGAGDYTCCSTHRDRCLIGQPHWWSTWFSNGQLQRTPDTYKCARCGGICTADED